MYVVCIVNESDSVVPVFETRASPRIYRVTPGLRKRRFRNILSRGKLGVTRRKLTRRHRRGNPLLRGKLGASKMAAHFDDDDDDSIISSAAYSY